MLWTLTKIHILCNYYYIMNSTTEGASVASDVSAESSGSILTTLIPFNLLKSTAGASQVVDWILYVSHYAMYFVIIIGVCTNLLSFAVFVRRLKEKSGPANMYLAALSMADALHIFWLSLGILLVLQPKRVNLHLATDCNFVSVMYFLVAQLSTLLVTTLTIDRCIAIRHPFLYRRIQGKKQAIGLITGLAVFVSIIGWHSFGGLQPIAEEELANEHNMLYCRGKTGWIDVYYLLWFPWIDIIIFWGIPSVIILICNMAIIKTIRSRVPQGIKPKKTLDTASSKAGNAPEIEAQVRCTAGSSNEQTNIAFQKHGRRLTHMSLIVSFSFFILVSPLLFYRLIIHMRSESPPMSEDVSQALEIILLMVYLINYICNFWLYCFAVPSFRKDLKEMMCGKICGSRCALTKKNQSRENADGNKV